MSRMVRTTRFSRMQDTNTALYDQMGRRITGDRSTLAPGETVSKRGAAPPPRTTAPSSTRVTSNTRVTATVTRPPSGQTPRVARPAPSAQRPAAAAGGAQRFSRVQDTNTAMYDQMGRRITGERPTLAPGEAPMKRGVTPKSTRVTSSTRITATVSRTPSRAASPDVEEYDDDAPYVDPAVERKRAQEEDKNERNLRKERETVEFHEKYYHLSKDKEKLEAYPGFRFGIRPPDPSNIHELGTYMLNVKDMEKQEAAKKKKAAKAAGSKSAGAISTVPPSAQPGKTPRKAPWSHGGKVRGSSRGGATDTEILAEIIERNRGRLQIQTDTFHNKYRPLCNDPVKLEAYPGFRFGMPVPDPADLLAVNGYMIMLREFEQTEKDANKPMTKAQKAKAEMDARVAAKRNSLRPPPPSAKPVKPHPGARPVYGHDGKANIWRNPKAPAEVAPTPSQVTIESQVEVEVETGPETMEMRIFKMRQMAYQKGVYQEPPVRTPARVRAPEPEPEPVRQPLPPPVQRPAPKSAQRGQTRGPTPSGTRKPPLGGAPPKPASHIPGPGSRIPGPGSRIPGPGSRIARPMVPVKVVSDRGENRSILVPENVVKAPHNSVVVVKAGTNVAVPVDEDVDPYADPDWYKKRPPPKTAFERMRDQEALQLQQDAVDKLRNAARSLHQERRKMMEKIEKTNLLLNY